jgi:hypothetical protein
VILAAGGLVLLGLGLFVAGLLTGATAFYWACVAACVAAALLLFVVRRRLSEAAPARAGAAGARAATLPATATAATPGGDAEAAPRSGAGEPAVVAEPVESVEPVAPAEAEAVPEDLPDPSVEEVEVTDLLLVVDLTDEVLVIDEHPRYHLAGCVHLRGRTPIPLPVDEARTDGFTPCAVCEPDRNLAERARARKAGRD